MRWTAWTTWTALAAVSACASVPQTHFYRLSPAGAAMARESIAGVLSIEPLEADAAYSDDRIAYRTSPVRLDYYNYHRWAAPPSILVADYLRTAYARTGLFERVVSGFHPTPAATVSGRLLAFDEFDRSETSWVGQLELELSLADAVSEKVLWRDRFVETEPIRDRSPEGLAVALSAAMDRVVRASAPAIAEAMQSAPRQQLPASTPEQD